MSCSIYRVPLQLFHVEIKTMDFMFWDHFA